MGTSLDDGVSLLGELLLGRGEYGRRRGGHCDALASVADHGHFSGPLLNQGVQAFEVSARDARAGDESLVARAFLGATRGGGDEGLVQSGALRLVVGGQQDSRLGQRRGLAGAARGRRGRDQVDLAEDLQPAVAPQLLGVRRHQGGLHDVHGGRRRLDDGAGLGHLVADDDFDPALAELGRRGGREGHLEVPHGQGRGGRLAGVHLELQDRHVGALAVAVLTVLPLVAAERVLAHERGVAAVAVEGLLGVQLGRLAAARPAHISPLCRLALERVAVELLHVLGQVAGLLGVEAAVAALEGPVGAVHAAVHAQGGLAGARVAALGALLGVLGLVQPAVLAERGLAVPQEVAVRTLEAVPAVLDADV